MRQIPSSPTTISLLSEEMAAVREELAPFQPAAIYLFGSASLGTMHTESDVDLAFLPARPCDPVTVFDAGARLTGVFGRSVDLIDLRRASTVMAKEVLRTGRLLQDNDRTQRQTFEMLTLSDYARLNEERHEILAASGVSGA